MTHDKTMFLASAMIAIIGSVSYHTIMKKTSATISPIIAILAIYLFVIVICAIYLLIFHRELSFYTENIKQINWVQFGVAISILFIEGGFLLMYRYHWNLGLGTVVTGVFVNLALLIIGTLVLKEGLSFTHILGVLSCILGVSLISLK